MKPKATAQRVRDAMGPEFRSQFRVKLIPGLVQPKILVRPKGRYVDLLKISHQLYPILAGEIMPQLRRKGFRAALGSYNTHDQAPVDITIYN